MKVRKGLAGLAVAMLALGSVARAADTTSTASDAIVMHPILADDAAAPAGPTTLLDAGLDKIGLYKPLNSLGINITGFVDGGWNYDMTVPNRNGEIPRRIQTELIAPDSAHKNSVELNQVALTIERDVDVIGKLQKGSWDVGFLVEGMYGQDTFYTHSNGLLDNNSFAHGNDGPDNELDLEQCTVSLGIPLGNGLTIIAGKFDTLLGYETIDAPKNPFYTHSYSADFGEPATQTGILANYYLTADGSLQVTAGATRGWNQSTNDDNGAIDFLGGVSWQVDKKLNVAFNLSVGPQMAADCSHYSTVPELIVKYKISDQLSLGADMIYGYQAQPGDTETQYYGVAAYAAYNVCKYATVNFRGEWYGDEGGATVGYGYAGAPAYPTPLGGKPPFAMATNNYYEATLGVAITPLPDTQYLNTLTIRPEIRYDWSDHGVYDGQKNKFSEVTAAVDAYFTF